MLRIFRVMLTLGNKKDRKNEKKYLYVVMYNEYEFVGKTTSVSSNRDEITIHYDSLTGSIPMV